MYPSKSLQTSIFLTLQNKGDLRGMELFLFTVQTNFPYFDISSWYTMHIIVKEDNKLSFLPFLLLRQTKLITSHSLSFPSSFKQSKQGEAYPLLPHVFLSLHFLSFPSPYSFQTSKTRCSAFRQMPYQFDNHQWGGIYF